MIIGQKMLITSCNINHFTLHQTRSHLKAFIKSPGNDWIIITLSVLHDGPFFLRTQGKMCQIVGYAFLWKPSMTVTTVFKLEPKTHQLQFNREHCSLLWPISQFFQELRKLSSFQIQTLYVQMLQIEWQLDGNVHLLYRDSVRSHTKPQNMWNCRCSIIC